MDDVASELDSSQRDCRNYSTELYRVRGAFEESNEQLEAVRRENKNLADEVKVSHESIPSRGMEQIEGRCAMVRLCSNQTESACSVPK